MWGVARERVPKFEGEIEKMRKDTRALIFETVLDGLAIGAIMASPISLLLRIGLIAGFIAISRSQFETKLYLDSKTAGFTRLWYFTAKFFADRLKSAEPDTESYEAALEKYSKSLVTFEDETAAARMVILVSNILSLFAGCVFWLLFAISPLANR